VIKQGGEKAAGCVNLDREVSVVVGTRARLFHFSGTRTDSDRICTNTNSDIIIYHILFRIRIRIRILSNTNTKRIFRIRIHIRILT
jgi:hypothetical protein